MRIRILKGLFQLIFHNSIGSKGHCLQKLNTSRISKNEQSFKNYPFEGHPVIKLQATLEIVIWI